MQSSASPEGDGPTPAQTGDARLSVAVILLRHGTVKYPDAEARLDRLVRPLEADCVVERLLVDNALPPDAQATESDGWRIIPGDNAAWEFSGFDRGMDAARRAWDPDAFLLVTDAFEAQQLRFEGLLSVAALRASIEGGAVLGICDYRNEVLAFDGNEFSTWLRSSFLLVPAGVGDALGTLVAIRDLDGLVPEEYTESWRRRPSPRFSEAYWRMLIGWLTRLWHTAIVPDRQSYPLFRDKLRSILNEHLLTVRLRRLDVPLVDLRYALKVGPGNAVRSRTSLDDQIRAILTFRDRVRDAVPTWLLRLVRKLGDRSAAAGPKHADGHGG